MRDFDFVQNVPVGAASSVETISWHFDAVSAHLRTLLAFERFSTAARHGAPGPIPRVRAQIVRYFDFVANVPVGADSSVEMVFSHFDAISAHLRTLLAFERFSTDARHGAPGPISRVRAQIGRDFDFVAKVPVGADSSVEMVFCHFDAISAHLRTLLAFERFSTDARHGAPGPITRVRESLGEIPIQSQTYRWVRKVVLSWFSGFLMQFPRIYALCSLPIRKRRPPFGAFR